MTAHVMVMVVIGVSILMVLNVSVMDLIVRCVHAVIIVPKWEIGSSRKNHSVQVVGMIIMTRSVKSRRGSMVV